MGETDEDDNEQQFLSLPNEILVFIISFLACARDLVKLRYVSKRIRYVCETPSLWRKIVWKRFEVREVCGIKEVFKECGIYIKKLLFTDHVTVPSTKLATIVRYCLNLVELRLSTMLNNKEVKRAISPMENLQSLDIIYRDASIHGLLTICDQHGLKEVTIRMAKAANITALFKDWGANKLTPKVLNIYCTGGNFMKPLIECMLMCKNRSIGSYFRVYRYREVPMNLSPQLPIFQLQLDPSCPLPFVKLSDCRVYGLEDYILLLTNHMYTCDTTGDTKKICMATVFREDVIDQNIEPKYGVISFNFITHFNAMYCDELVHSGHLEQLAVACPNLLELNLRNNVNCLKSLNGLSAIATHCKHLRGLNLLFISAIYVENQVKLWEILSGKLKLIYLAIDLCALMPDKQATEEIVNLYQKCSSLKALEIKYCENCHEHQSFSLLAKFSSLLHLLINTLYFNHPTAVTDIISACTTLRFLIYSTNSNFDLSSSLMLNSHSLEELHLDVIEVDIPDIFMEYVSCHGGLVHVFMTVNLVTTSGVEILVQNSPKLISFYITSTRIYDSSGDQANLQYFKRMLKKKHGNRQLFTSNSFNVTADHEEVNNLIIFKNTCTQLNSVW